ncbi:MAG: hypothetical protein KA384_05025 [Leptotrichiaceae bacterium]|nr:hypothetical protein [Leptotrichiaceae bacterium]
MNICELLSEIKENHRGKNNCISLGRIVNSFFAQFDIKISKDEIEKMLNLENEFFVLPEENLIWKETFYNFAKNISKEKLKETLEFEYFINFSDSDIEKIIKWLDNGTETAQEPKFDENINLDDLERKNNIETQSELSLNLNKINEGLKMLEPLLVKREFWVELLRITVGNRAMTSKEIYKNLIFFNKIDYREEISEVLNDKKYFKIVDLYGAYAKIENMSYSEIKENFSEELQNFIREFNDNYKIIFERKILKNQTLQEIGYDINLSRERVRQLEMKLREKMKLNKFQHILRPYFQYIIDFFEKQKEKIFNINEFHYYLKSKNECFSGINFEIIDFFNEENTLGKKIRKLNNKFVSLLSKDEVNGIFSKIFKFQNFMSENELYINLKMYQISNKDFIDEYIEENYNIERCNGFIMYQDTKITMIDKLELLFKLEDRTLKIAELVALYKKYFGVELTEHDMGSKLIINQNKFTRVFTGTYSLTEWGMDKHIMAKDLIIECLKEARKPLHHSEIVACVKPKTKANENTIRVFISNENTFGYSHGYFALKEWVEDEELSKKFFISNNRIAASDKSVVNDNYKGTFEKDGVKINLHKVGQSYFEYNGSMDVGKSFCEDILVGKIKIYTTDKRYIVTLSQNKKNLSGIKRILEDKKLKFGDYFYIENLKNEILKLYTWEEFENGVEIKITTEFEEKANSNLKDLNYQTAEVDKKELKVKEEEFEIENKFKNFSEILDFGLKEGYIKRDWLTTINYDTENFILNYWQAVEEIEEREIKIIE